MSIKNAPAPGISPANPAPSMSGNSGTTVNGNFYANLGNADSAIPHPVVPYKPPVNPTGDAIVSTHPIHQEAKNNSNALDAALGNFGLNPQNPDAQKEKEITIDTVSDPYMKALNDLATRSNDSTKRLIASIQSAKQNQQNNIDKQYSNYKSGLQLLGIQHNEAQATPDLLSGHIQEAENQHQQKISALDAEESKALMDAENARADNDFKTLKEKMDYVKQLKKDKADALKDMYTAVTQQNTVSKGLAYQVYGTLNKLNPDEKETFLQAVAKKYKLPVDVLVQSVADEGTKRAKGTGSGTASKKSLVSNIDKIFSNTKKDEDGYSVLGSDGFIDPDAYLQAYQSWIQNGFSAKEFATQFPANDYVNSDSYDRLPAQLKPKKSSSTTPGGFHP